MPLQPASSRMPRVRAGSAKAVGPGDPGAGGEGRSSSRAVRTSVPRLNIWFSPEVRQQTKVSRAPGAQAPRMLAKAVVGSAKNMTPNREMT